MKICVTGARGFIGAHVVDALQPFYSDLLTPSSSELNIWDYAKVESYFALHRPSHLIHLAWYAKHGMFWGAPENARWMIATNHLLRSFYSCGGRRCVGVGSCAEYRWGSPETLKEESVVAPASFYGHCKNQTRQDMEMFCEKNGYSWAWARVFFPYGIGEGENKLIPSLVHALQGKRSLFGVNKLAVRDFIHVSDVARALVCLIRIEQNGIFNIGSGVGISLQEMVEQIAEIFRVDPTPLLEIAPERLDPIPSIVADASKLTRLGWNPQIQLSSGLLDVHDFV